MSQPFWVEGTVQGGNLGKVRVNVPISDQVAFDKLAFYDFPRGYSPQDRDALQFPLKPGDLIACHYQYSPSDNVTE